MACTKSVVSMLVLIATLAFGTPAMAGASEADAALHRAYYLQHEQKDFKLALAIYKKLAGQADVPKAVKARAAEAMTQCRAALLAADFARLMSPETLAYIEIRKTGDQIGRLTDMLGLLGHATAVGTPPAPDVDVPEPRPELALTRLRISPALVREFKKIGGLAVGITGVDGDAPEGVAVLDPGQCDLVRGLLETGIPALTPIGEIEGWPAYGIEKVGVVLTERMIIVGRPRENAAAAARRLRASERQPSLADDPGLAETASWRDHALVFGYVNTKAALPLLRERFEASGEADHLRRIEALLDLEHLESVAFRAGVTESGVSADLAIAFAEGHQSLALNLARTPPLSTHSLKCVPEGAAGVLAFALSSAEAKFDSGTGTAETVRQITGLDFGREIFANIEEVAVFVMPPGVEGPGSGAPSIKGAYIPDAGVAITVKDPAQSDALWSQLLGLPTLILGPSKSSAEPTKIGGTDTTVYKFPEDAQIVYAHEGNQILLGTSERAVAMMARARRERESVLTDKAFRAVTTDLGRDTSKLLAVHVGRACKLAAQYAPPEMAIPLKVMAPNAAKELIVCALTQETPTALMYHAGVVNLPPIRVILEHLQKLAAMAGDRAPHAKLAGPAEKASSTPDTDGP